LSPERFEAGCRCKVRLPEGNSRPGRRLAASIIDAAILSAPSTLTARSFGLKELLNVTALKIPFVQHGIGTTRSFINTNQDLVRRFVRSAAEGIDYARKNRGDTIAILSKYTKITDPAQLQESLSTNEPAWERIPTPNQQAIEAVLGRQKIPKPRAPSGSNL